MPCWREKPILRPRHPAGSTWPALTSRDALLRELRLPSCAFDILASCALEVLTLRPDLCYQCPPCNAYSQSSGCYSWTGRSLDRSRPRVPAQRVAVDHAYVIHYSRVEARRTFQVCQFVRLGVNASFVVGLDREDITEAVQDCLLAPAGQGVCVSPGSHTCPIDMRKADMAYVSQTAKLYVALLDAYRMEYRSILVCEDDAEVRWDLLPSLNGALHRLGAAEGGFRILFAGAYKRADRLKTGLYEKTPANWPGHWRTPKAQAWRTPYRSAGMPMAATGTVITQPGIRHLLRSLPIATSIDLTLSDVRMPSGNQTGMWVLKPMPFVPYEEFNQNASKHVGLRLNPAKRTINPFGYGNELIT